MFKKWLHLLLFAFAVSLAMGAAQGAIERIPEGLFPLTDEPKTLKVFIGMGGNPNVEDFPTNTFTKW